MGSGKIGLISGGVANDSRGQIRFVNDFNMSDIKRFYIIKNINTNIVRGWRGHRIEQRWFYVLSGAFEMYFVKIDDWESPSPQLPVEKYILKGNEQRVVHVQSGWATAFRALEINSEILVFADHGIKDIKEDDYTWPVDYFVIKQEDESLLD